MISKGKKVYTFIIKKHPKKVIFVLLLLLLWYWFVLPNPLFDTPTSIVLEDEKHNLLGARIAADGQWRFPSQIEIPDKFIKAITEFEDRRFFYHPGIDPIGIGRAMLQNIRSKKIVSGGSTLTMQVIRLSRYGKPRTLWQKLIEVILATRLELRHTKAEILALYAAHAPFGGNVVGLEAASWRYYQKKPTLLTWAEAATLAVLPNSPALIHPGRNRKALLEKRNRLLRRLYENGTLDRLTYELAIEEQLPQKPFPIPQLAPHLLDKATKEHFTKNNNHLTRLQTTINADIQDQATRVLERHQAVLRGNDINNIATIIQEVKSGKVLAYVGNVLQAGAEHNNHVDVIQAPRSTGSILKPFLYAAALQGGIVVPSTIISDVPTQIKGYKPENFHPTFDGVVSARRALIRSLNVPMIRLLSEFGLERFHFYLQKLGLTTITQPANHYGLPLILGGAEGRLSELTNAYTCMARTLNHFQELDGRYSLKDFREGSYVFNPNMEAFTITNKFDETVVEEAPVFSAAAIYQTFEAMRQVERPDSEGNWEYFESSQSIAWKTGTSIGFRDAWAIGVNTDYAVGVWVGNADGEGRPGLVGVEAAAPVLFDLFDLLPSGDWFTPPYDDLSEIEICKQSGLRATSLCEKDTILADNGAFRIKTCNYHQQIHLDKSQQFQVSSDCENPLNMVHRSWFILPPVEAFYYRFKNPNYLPLPPFREDCKEQSESLPMQLIYPTRTTKIYIPVDINGQLSRTVFRVAHRVPKTTIYWHLDDIYIGKTEKFHELELIPKEGKHILTLVDDKGFQLSRTFEILGKG